MKFYFNRKPVRGPWGGGSKILSSIIEECNKRDHEVFFGNDLFKVRDFDVLFCMDPRPSEEGLEFSNLLDYKYNFKNCKLVQRIGDLGTHGKPELLELAKSTSEHSDVLIFPSQWAMEFFGKFQEKSIIIKNAPINKFLDAKKQTHSQNTKTKLVTHHWSDNPKKGFKLYQKLDEFCQKNREKFEFTYIGRLPNDVALSNHVQPLDVDGLIKELPKHDVYVTSSLQEAGANHVLEAMAIGLPILYNENGGSIPEYCYGNGISFQSYSDLKIILEVQLELLKGIKVNYSRTSTEMAKEYVDLLEGIK